METSQPTPMGVSPPTLHLNPQMLHIMPAVRSTLLLQLQQSMPFPVAALAKDLVLL
jgi:hypothetical protein